MINFSFAPHDTTFHDISCFLNSDGKVFVLIWMQPNQGLNFIRDNYQKGYKSLGLNIVFSKWSKTT